MLWLLAQTVGGTIMQSRTRESKTMLTAFAVLAFVGVALMTLSPAQAGHFSGASSETGCIGINMADNATHSFFYTTTVPQYMKNAVNAIRAESYDPTDINTLTSTDVNSGTDVVAYQQDYGSWCQLPWNPSNPGVVGHEQCVSLVVSNGRCQKAEIRFDESFVSSASAAGRKFVACHESGHTLGLNHRASTVDSCMWPDPSKTRIDQHDRDAINANY